MQLPCAMGSMQLFFETSSFIRGLLTTTHIQWASAGRGQISRWILKFLAKKGYFLSFEREKPTFATFPPPRQKSFRSPCAHRKSASHSSLLRHFVLSSLFLLWRAVYSEMIINLLKIKTMHLVLVTAELAPLLRIFHAPQFKNPGTK